MPFEKNGVPFVDAHEIGWTEKFIFGAVVIFAIQIVTSGIWLGGMDGTVELIRAIKTVINMVAHVVTRYAPVVVALKGSSQVALGIIRGAHRKILV